MLIVPSELNRNAKDVQEMASPAETGRMLISYMCKRIGIDSLAGLDVLDLGCGVRFTEALLNLELPIGSYTGLDVSEPVIDFLKANVSDARFRYHRVNASNDRYNPMGDRNRPYAPSPVGGRMFHIACMFSVITHQNPDEAVDTFTFLRRHVLVNGHLFFSAFIHDDRQGYRELAREQPGHKSSYSLSLMTDTLVRTGWSVVSVVDPVPDGVPIMTSFVCRPRRSALP